MPVLKQPETYSLMLKSFNTVTTACPDRGTQSSKHITEKFHELSAQWEYGASDRRTERLNNEVTHN